MITATPAHIQAGDSLSWSITWEAYPASAGWSLSYVLINTTGKIELSSDADGDAHLVSADAATTADYLPGIYVYAAQVSMDAQRITVERGSIEVLADIAQAATFDGRTPAAITLANIDAVLSGKASADNLAYTINGRSLSRYTWADLIAARKYFMGLVNSEQRAQSGKRSNKVLVQFSTPGGE